MIASYALLGRNRAPSSLSELKENKLLLLPDEKDRIFDVELGMLMLNGYAV